MNEELAALISISVVIIVVLFITFSGDIQFSESIDTSGAAIANVFAPEDSSACDSDSRPSGTCGCQEGKWITYQLCRDQTITCGQCLR